MEIRPLRRGEEALWVGLTCNDASAAEKTQELKDYRERNAHLHPASYLAAFDGDRLVAKLRTYADDPTVYGLAALHVDRSLVDSGVGLALVERALEIFTDRPLEAMSWDKPEGGAWHEVLLKSGFEVFVEKHYFRRDLGGYRSPYRDPFTYRSLEDVGEQEYLRLFARIYPGNLNRNFSADPAVDFREMRDSAGAAYGANQWQVAALDGEPAGVIVPKIFDDMPNEGTIHTFGVFPELRGRGLGKILHAKGLEDLAKAGAVRYVGSADRRNAPMIATFKANGCWDRGVRRQYRAKSGRG